MYVWEYLSVCIFVWHHTCVMKCEGRCMQEHAGPFHKQYVPARMCSHAVYYLHNAIQGVSEFFMQAFALFIQSSKNCVIRELQHKYSTFRLHSTEEPKSLSLCSGYMWNLCTYFFKNHTLNIYNTKQSKDDTNNCGTATVCKKWQFKKKGK